MKEWRIKADGIVYVSFEIGFRQGSDYKGYKYILNPKLLDEVFGLDYELVEQSSKLYPL